MYFCPSSFLKFAVGHLLITDCIVGYFLFDLFSVIKVYRYIIINANRRPVIKKKALKSKSKTRSFEKYKQLTSFLFEIKDNDLDVFIESCTVRELDGFKFRACAQLSGYPHIVWYLDKYMNSLYDSSDISFKNFIYTINAIVRMNNIQGPNSLKFSKFQNVERNTFYTDVTNIYKILRPSLILNNADILCLYNMYQNGIISPTDISELKEHTEPSSEGKATRVVKTKTTKSKSLIGAVKATKPVITNEAITKYKNNILQFVKNRANCDTCPLQKNGFLIISTNASRPTNADIMFINDGASDQELDSQEHFSMYVDLLNNIKDICSKFKLTYAFVNLTLCNTRNATTPAKMKQAVNACNGIYSEIQKTFKSRINVLFGETVKSTFGIKGGRSTKLHGQMIGNNIISVSPDKMTDKNLIILLKSLVDEIGKTKFNRENVEVEPDDSFKGRIVNNITPDLTLFDIKEINSKILYVFINKDGAKVYYIEDMQFPVYIKSGNMSECDFILEKEPDEKTILNKNELQSLKRTLRDNLNANIRL